ncbi:M81 family metallopeptidase [Stella sp.]|uniref:M81 family metallopeptidase n=1 Tax=Stella sp. TaxID=2912054 RepID=UPI0035B25721
MKIVVAAFSHETNSFSPVPTTIDRFGIGAGPYYGAAARAAFEKTGMPMAAFIRLAEASGATVTTPVAARCSPSAPVDAHAYDTICGAILDAVRQGCDAALLDLHGAMIAEPTDDGEGTLLARIRAIAPDLPIGVALDFHTNLTEAMVGNATVAVGYRTYPHLDMYEAGERAGRLLLDALAGRVRPVMEWGNAPMLPHTLKQDTGDEPMRGLMALAAEAEREPGILAVTMFAGFPLADTREAGLSVLVVADGDRARARAVRDRLLAAAWAARAGLVHHPRPLADQVAEARRLAEGDGRPGPVLLIDHADNCNSGGTLDAMSVVAEAIRQGLTDVAVAPVCDPGAVAELTAAGVGARRTVDIGGKMAAPTLTEQPQPLRLAGRVGAIADGMLTVTGPVFTGTALNMGPSVRFDADCGVQIVVTSRRIEPYDLAVFRALGIEPAGKRFLVLKSRIQYKPTFLPIARAVVECDGVGVASSDYSLFRFRRLRRPIYPIDPDARFRSA